MVARMTLEDGLRELGLTVADSQANFVWCGLPVADGGDAAAEEQRVLTGLAERGYQVRAGGALGRAGWLRVSFGTPAQNDGFLAAMRELVA